MKNLTTLSLRLGAVGSQSVLLISSILDSLPKLSDVSLHLRNSNIGD